MTLNEPITSQACLLPSLDIRQVTKEDLTALEWEGQYKHFRNIYTQAFIRAQKGLAVLWVADLNDKIVIGQVFIQLVCGRLELADGKSRAYLYGFRIRPAYRSQGIGSLMLVKVEDDLKKRQFKIVCLNVAKDNLKAQSLYNRHGYLITAHEPGCWSYQDAKGDWQEVEEPAWRMEKHL